jgi:hypothetical protein
MEIQMEAETAHMSLFVEGLSMLNHEQFEELCALAATGQLSSDEQQQLNEHLEGCQACRAACEEFSLVLRELPATEGRLVDRAVFRQIDESESRKQFLARARAGGRRFSEEAQKGPSDKRWRFPRRLLPAYQWVAAGAAVIILFAVVGYRAIRKGGEYPHSAALQTANAPADSQHAEGASDGVATRISELQSSNEAAQKTVSELKTQNALLLARVEGLEKALGAGEAVKQDLERRMARVTDMNSQFASQMDQNTQALAQTRAELEKARADRATMEVALAAEKAEVSDISQQMRLQAASLDQDRQLLMAGRDITGLMGARNLHIIDVHDADGSGKNRKSFGRVFYTEGKSLIFYAFDLDEKKLANAKYTFEAWGERLGQPSTVKSLGVLFADDKEQRRWVLKVDDPQQLAEIDSVFVTLEPHDGGSDKPRGKKILYAFLSGKANHP